MSFTPLLVNDYIDTVTFRQEIWLVKETAEFTKETTINIHLFLYQFIYKYILM